MAGRSERLGTLAQVFFDNIGWFVLLITLKNIAVFPLLNGVAIFSRKAKL